MQKSAMAEGFQREGKKKEEKKGKAKGKNRDPALALHAFKRLAIAI